MAANLEAEERYSPNADLEKVEPKEEEAVQVVEALEANFDDPNIDHNEAIAGILGEFIQLSSNLLPGR